MVTLDNFYQSDEWRRLREIVINERTKPDGFVYDEVTGQPILKPYDIILHHKVYLTPDNVNDASIALNPDNLQIVSHKTHNKIHEKFGYVRREIYLVWGSPLAGKNFFVAHNRVYSDLIIDIDNIWQCISGLPRYQKPPVLNSVAFGVRDYLMDCVKVRRGKWQNAYIIGGFPLSSERERICRLYGARSVFIDTPKEICLQRLESDPDRDKDAWKGYIEQWWERFNPSPSAVNMP